MGFGESTQGNQRKLDGPGKVSTELSLVNLEAKNLHPKPECNQPIRKGQRPGFLLKAISAVFSWGCQRQRGVQQNTDQEQQPDWRTSSERSRFQPKL
ncbi:Os10g0397900 [Oryza sativa Japonica Group]|uniref:Os10g0397900 protein n=1 Tax=Oryza sativa subsp. japonica TaxID=39947 RepID=Q0IXU8_ORYSJ|nr:Os10g0397900 [Oryza sativa Japonica Group]|eukprot:NP_001064536.1 Os10g0397900 [Oryza sativa Japonica Group]